LARHRGELALEVRRDVPREELETVHYAPAARESEHR